MEGALTQRRSGMKTMWRDLSSRARLGEVFGFIDAIALIYKLGYIDRDRVVELLAHHNVSKADLAEYRKVRGEDEALVAAGTVHR